MATLGTCGDRGWPHSVSQVEAALGSSDLGCSPGGGPDAVGIFGAAGLVLGLQGGSPTVPTGEWGWGHGDAGGAEGHMRWGDIGGWGGTDMGTLRFGDMEP